MVNEVNDYGHNIDTMGVYLTGLISYTNTFDILTVTWNWQKQNFA